MGWNPIDTVKDTVSKTAGFFSGGIVGDDVWGLDITGKQAAKDAEAALRAGNLSAQEAEQQMFLANMDFQRENIDYQREQTAPWLAAGKRGLAGYEQLLRDPSSVTQNPGYQFRLDQGLEGVTNSSAAGGMLLSGNTLKGLTEYGQNFATNEYANALNRYNTLANYGTGATGFNVQGAQQYGNTMGNLYSQQGQNMSNFHMNQAQIAANAAQQGHNNTMGMLNTGLSALSLFTPAAPFGAANLASGGAGAMNTGGRDFLQPLSGYGQQSLSI